MKPTKQPRGYYNYRRQRYYDHSYKVFVTTDVDQYFSYEAGRFDSVNTPGFNKVKKPKLPVNPHYWNRELVLYQPGFYETRYNYKPLRTYSNVTASIDNGIDVLCPYAASARLADLNNTVRLKIKNSDFNAGVALGEFRETSKFLEHRVGQVVRGLSKAATVDISKPAEKKRKFVPPFIRERGTRKWIRNPRYPALKWPDLPTELSNHWLEYSYAYLPLLSEIHGAAKMLAELPYAAERRTVRSRLSIEEPFSGAYPMGLLTWNVISGTRKVSREIGVHFNVDNPLLQRGAALGLTNPLAIGYELTRLSFVLDWFLPLGTTIESLDATLGCTFTKGFQTTVWESRSSSECHVNNSAVKQDSFVEIRRKIFQRVVLNDFPGVSMPRPRLPSYFGQALSGIALLHQLFRK